MVLLFVPSVAILFPASVAVLPSFSPVFVAVPYFSLAHVWAWQQREEKNNRGNVCRQVLFLSTSKQLALGGIPTPLILHRAQHPRRFLFAYNSLQQLSSSSINFSHALLFFFCFFLLGSFSIIFPSVKAYQLPTQRRQLHSRVEVDVPVHLLCHDSSRSVPILVLALDSGGQHTDELEQPTFVGGVGEVAVHLTRVEYHHLPYNWIVCYSFFFCFLFPFQYLCVGAPFAGTSP